MNERILKIAGQNCVGEYHAGILCWRFSEDQLRKFAEAIVRECVHVAVFKDDGMISTADVAGYIAAGRASAAKIIKQHFGVEE